MARAQVGEDSGLREREAVGSIGARLVYDRNSVAKVELDCLSHVPQAELVAAQVLQHGDRTVLPFRCGAHAGDNLGMLFQRAVGEIEPRHVHAGGNQPVQRLRRPGGRSDGGDYLGFAHLFPPGPSAR